MVIKENSWHYRVYEFGYSALDRWPPSETNLCRYFWRVMWGLFLGTMMVTVALLVLGLLGTALYNFTFITLTVLGVIAALIGAGIAYDRRPYKEKVKVEPGLLRLYLRAKKEKVCPLVEFVAPERS